MATGFDLCDPVRVPHVAPPNRDRITCASRVLTRGKPFRSVGSGRRAMIIHPQTLNATGKEKRAVETLPKLLPQMADRETALKAGPDMDAGGK